MNQVNIIGNLTKDIEITSLPNGTKIAKSTIAANSKVKKDDGTIREKVLFIDFITYGKRAENLAKFTKKGSKLRITGELELQQWEKEGQKHSKHIISVDEFDFLDAKKGSNGSSKEPSPDSNDVI